MMKRALALTLALIVLLQPVAASAATWNEIMNSLYMTGSYSDGSTHATMKGDEVSVTGGSVENVSIYNAGKYTFTDVSLEGVTCEIWLNTGETIELTLNKDVVFNTTDYGLDIYAYNGSSVIVHNNTTIAGNYDSLYIDTDDSSKITVDGEGAVSAGQTADDEPVFIYMEGDGSEMELLSAIRNQIRIDQALLQADGADLGTIATSQGVYYLDENGALYAYNEQGEKIVLFEDFFAPGSAAMPGEAEAYDEEAALREADEALRQAGAVGGVTTSIFWNKQMYLGHSCYNGRVYYKGEVEMTRQSLSWLPGGAESGKNYTLRINKLEVSPADVEIRLAQDILDVCARADIRTITLVDREMNQIAQFAVADLIAAREMYALEAEELICVSADPNAEVMKVTLEGEYLPIEPETEEAA